MLSSLLLATAFVLGTLAVPQAPEITPELTASNWTSYRTISATVTYLHTSNLSATSTSTGTKTRPFNQWHTSTLTPEYEAAVLYAYKPGAPFHMFPFIAKDSILRLGGLDNTAYCPENIDNWDGGSYCKTYYNVTAFYECFMSVSVPGGQSIYMTPDGQFKFNYPHSHTMIPEDSVACPWRFRWSWQTDIVVPQILPDAFGATGFLACPMLDTSRMNNTKQQWQIYGNVPNATIWYGWEQKDASWCTPFDVFGVAKWLPNSAAWEYH